MNDTLNGLILLPHLKVQNANAVSGPITWGFPAPSAFTGFVHALARGLGMAGLDGAGIVCHRFIPQVYRPTGKYHYRFNLARHPMGKDGKPPGTIEEGRAFFETSLLIGIHDYLDEREGQNLADDLAQKSLGMRLAGGSVLPAAGRRRYRPSYFELSGAAEEDKKIFKRISRRLLPGFALISRHELLREHLAEIRVENPEATALDALLQLVCLNVDPVGEDPSQQGSVLWQASRTKPGWLVPLPTGYGALSEVHEPGRVRNTRDEKTPFRFVESLCSLGEWVSPHRLEHPGELLWYHRADPQTGLYLCDHKKTSA